MSCIVSMSKQSTPALRDQHELPLKSMLLTNLIPQCIGVMHIVDMYASCSLNQISSSLLGTTPNMRVLPGHGHVMCILAITLMEEREHLVYKGEIQV